MYHWRCRRSRNRCHGWLNRCGCGHGLTHNGSLRGWRWRHYRRLDCHWRLGRSSLHLAGRCRSDRRLYHNNRWRRHNCNRWPRWRNCARRSLGNNRSNRWPRSDCRGSLRRSNNRRRLTRLWNDAALFRTLWRRWRRRNCHNRWCWLGGRRRGRHYLRPARQAALSRRFLFFKFLGQDGLRRVAWLLDMREIELGRYALGGA